MLFPLTAHRRRRRQHSRSVFSPGWPTKARFFISASSPSRTAWFRTRTSKSGTSQGAHRPVRRRPTSRTGAPTRVVATRCLCLCLATRRPWAPLARRRSPSASSWLRPLHHPFVLRESFPSLRDQLLTLRPHPPTPCRHQSIRPHPPTPRSLTTLSRPL